MPRTVVSVAAFAILSIASTTLFARAEQADLALPQQNESTTTLMRISPRASESVRGILIAEDHRARVTSLVHSLEYVADKESVGNAAGAQLRLIAIEEERAVATTTQAIQKTAARGSLKRMVLGNDYHNIALLKKRVSQMQHTIERLEALRAEATNTTDTAILDTQILALEEDRKTLASFIRDHDRAAGLFGWLTKLAADADAGNTDTVANAATPLVSPSKERATLTREDE